MRRSAVFVSVALVLNLVIALQPAAAGLSTNTKPLRQAVTTAGIMQHLEEFQDIADANGGTRASGTPGYDASGQYVFDRLKDAGYTVRKQFFDFAFFEEFSPAQLMLGPESIETQSMSYSGSGTVTGPAVPVDVNVTGDRASDSGCDESDFAGIDWSGTQVALIQRGTCDFVVKANNAEAAGAEGVIIFNQGNTEDRMGLIGGTLGTPVGIPVVDVSFADGVKILNSNLPVTIITDTQSEIRNTFNVLADSTSGRTDRVVVVGAHLDSETAGEGINDNGSGSAAILEIAEEIAELGLKPTNRLRFAFWGAEESGLLGAEHYVSTLTQQQQAKIMLNLNFDMVGSPNFVRFVYDGNGSATGTKGPSGSGRIETIFNEYFASKNLPVEATAFDGRSDYGPFIEAGIPAGGLFTGAEGTKTAAQAATYGGLATFDADGAGGDPAEAVPYDPCYHEFCDALDQSDMNAEDTALYAALDSAYNGALVGNVNTIALNQMSDAAAHATWVFAMTQSAPQGTSRASEKAKSYGFFDNLGHAAKK